MTDNLSVMARKLLAENYRDGVRAIELFTLGVVDIPPDADLTRHMTHIAKSSVGTAHTRTKLNQSLLRKLRLAIQGQCDCAHTT